MMKLIKLIISILVGWLIKRKAAKTIEVRRYDIHEEWERKLYELEDEKDTLERAAKEVADALPYCDDDSSFVFCTRKFNRLSKEVRVKATAIKLHRSREPKER